MLIYWQNTKEDHDQQPWGGEELVFRRKEGLAIVYLPTMNPISEMVRLKRIEGDRFHTIRSDGQPGHEVVFERDGNGRVTARSGHQ